jgi:hypothetical protein
MTLQEAIQTGKRFKRGKDTYWHRCMFGRETFLFSKEDISAMDWEVEIKKVTITKADLMRAFSRIMQNSEYFHLPLQDSLLLELGLSD